MIPGPGAYNTDSNILCRSAPAYSLKSRHPDHSKDYVPGVGTYNLPQRGYGPAFSLSSRYKKGTDFVTPAPGDYAD